MHLARLAARGSERIRREVRDVAPGVHLLNQLGGGRALTLEDPRGQRVKLGRWHHPCAARTECTQKRNAPHTLRASCTLKSPRPQKTDA